MRVPKNVFVLTRAGISAESGVATFRCLGLMGGASCGGGGDLVSVCLRPIADIRTAEASGRYALLLPVLDDVVGNISELRLRDRQLGPPNFPSLCWGRVARRVPIRGEQYPVHAHPAHRRGNDL